MSARAHFFSILTINTATPIHSFHPHQLDCPVIIIIMTSPQDAFRQLQKAASRFSGGGGGPSPRGIGGGITAIVVLGGGIVLANNALFNVDGGHRAIKYTRLGGVGKEIYAEGIKIALPAFRRWQLILACRNTFQGPMVRDAHRLRCQSQTTQCCLSYRNEGSPDGQYYLPCPVQTQDRCASPNIPNIRYRL
jgi:hypothetical protein